MSVLSEKEVLLGSEEREVAKFETSDGVQVVFTTNRMIEREQKKTHQPRLNEKSIFYDSIARVEVTNVGKGPAGPIKMFIGSVFLAIGSIFGVYGLSSSGMVDVFGGVNGGALVIAGALFCVAGVRYIQMAMNVDNGYEECTIRFVNGGSETYRFEKGSELAETMGWEITEVKSS